MLDHAAALASDSPTIAWLNGLTAALSRATCRIESRPAPLDRGLEAVRALLTCLRDRGGRVWWAGNGGNAALCSHLSQDFIMRCGLSSTVLTDPALTSCVANDHGYPEVFARPLRVLIAPGDLLIAVSSSGNSENIIRAARLAKSAGARLVTLTAFDPGNRLNALPSDVSFHLPTATYGHAEIGHEALLHALVDTWAA